MRRRWLGLPWWWWLLDLAALIGTAVKALSGLEGPKTWADVATIGAFVLALSVVVASIIPWTRARLLGLLRFLRSLPSLFPLRVVKSSTLEVLRARQLPEITEEDIENDRRTREEQQQPPRPLTLRVRLERAVDFCEGEMGRYDAMDPRKRPIGYFRTAARTVNEVVDELERERVGMDFTLQGGIGRRDDPTRADVEAAVRSLRRIDWKA